MKMAKDVDLKDVDPNWKPEEVKIAVMIGDGCEDVISRENW